MIKAACSKDQRTVVRADQTGFVSRFLISKKASLLASRNSQNSILESTWNVMFEPHRIGGSVRLAHRELM